MTENIHPTRSRGAAAALFAALSAAQVAEARPMGTLFSPAEPSISYEETVDRSDPAAPALREVGSWFSFAFTGGSLTLHFEDTGVGDDQHAVRVSVDGEEKTIHTTTGDHPYVVVRGLPDVRHQTVVTLLTESKAPLIFHGVDLDPGAELRSPDDAGHLILEPGETYSMESASGPLCFYNGSATIAEMRLCMHHSCSAWSGTKTSGQRHRFPDYAADYNRAELWIHTGFKWVKRHEVQIGSELKAGQTLHLKGTVFDTSWQVNNTCS